AVCAWALPQIPVNGVGAALIVIFSFFFVTVASRIVGLIGSSSSPVSGMTIGTLLATSVVFLRLGWTGPEGTVAAVTVGAVVCVAISIAGDTSQDLKTGFLVGATPWRQQVGEMIGVLTSAVCIGWVVFFLHRAYGIGSERLPAPQAVLMSMVVKGVLTMSLPWTLVIIGVCLAACVELLGAPSLPFAVGLYLPIRLTTPVAAGAVVRYLFERTRTAAVRHERRERGVLFASGLIAGGAIVGIVVAGLVNAGIQERMEVGFEWAGSASGLVSVAVFLVLAAALALAAGLGSGRAAAGGSGATTETPLDDSGARS
ncbi:MAG: OPT/YSL family transporter, partial [Candidatus Eisenbacteria bacterium]|nr:OPT/YSL family transporter [Candidatus Eisenbacteria bacterium]